MITLFSSSHLGTGYFLIPFGLFGSLVKAMRLKSTCGGGRKKEIRSERNQSLNVNCHNQLKKKHSPHIDTVFGSDIIWNASSWKKRLKFRHFRLGNGWKSWWPLFFSLCVSTTCDHLYLSHTHSPQPNLKKSSFILKWQVKMRRSQRRLLRVMDSLMLKEKFCPKSKFYKNHPVWIVNT
jgi:hypothetical protein